MDVGRAVCVSLVNWVGSGEVVAGNTLDTGSRVVEIGTEGGLSSAKLN